jgi:hypothetical protein
MVDLPCPSYALISVSSKLVFIRTLLLIQEGNLKKALAGTQEIIHDTQCDPYDTLMTQWISICKCPLGIEAWNEVLQKCDDSSLLREMLEQQHELAGRLHFLGDQMFDLRIVEQVGILRELKRCGYEADYQNLTGRELDGRCKATLALFLEKEGLPAVNRNRNADPQLSGTIRSTIKTYREEAISRSGQPHSLLGLWLCYQDSIVTPFECKENLSAEKLTMCSKILLSRFDLLRLATASKLYMVEHGKAPEKMADLAPAYLPAPLVDRLARGKAPYAVKEGRFYSVGPDGKDDRLKVNYDPSNGTVSGGDLALKQSAQM